MTQFALEIAEQPEVAARLLAEAGPALAEAADALRGVSGLVIAARGSSDHAATYAKYLFEVRNGIPVALAAPSAFTLYRRPPRLDGFGVIAISQSGGSEDVNEVVAEAGRQGVPSVVLTNDVSSPLARAAGHVLDLRAGRERSVPASKTYTASLLLLAMLSQALRPRAAFAAALAGVPDAIAIALDLRERLAEAGDLLRGPLAVLGRGFNLATAQEVALKIMETCGFVVESRSLADFLHGPIATVGDGSPVLLIAAGGPTLPEMRALAERLSGLGARVVALTDRARLPAAERVELRTSVPEALTPIPFAVAGQLLALGLTERMGRDPDHPLGLTKVTSTR